MNYRTASHPQGACPRCYNPLEPQTIEGMRFDACRQCGGVFVDLVITASMARTPNRAVSEAIFAIAVAKKEFVTTPGSEPLSCPECGIALRREHVAPAICDIDFCDEHGTWFDAHEFHHVAQALANKRKRRHGL